jgi:hypothetical protein
MDNALWGLLMIPAAFEPFLEEAPLCVMTRVALETLFDPARLDALFRDTAQRQYERELLFSQVVELMTAVVLCVHPSVLAAYKKRRHLLSVSDQALYDKLRCMELGVSEALVADSAAQVAPVLQALGGGLPSWLPGYRTQVLDGNHLPKTERRLKELRHTWAAALPGKVLAVYDQELDLITRVFLTPDGQAQERSLLDDVLPCVRARDLWVADRDFCTLKFLFGIAAVPAAFVIRQHGQLEGRRLGQRRWRGRTATGKVYEQALRLEHEGRALTVRRITVVLDQPTEGGDTEIHILTNLSAAAAGAAQVAELYRKRWTIAGRFYEVTQTLNCEPNTLGYPQAALFAFCLALVASHAVALLKAALRAAHEDQAVAQMSSYYMSLEIQETYRGMLIALPPIAWEPFRALPAADLAAVLRAVARRVQPAQYAKAKRGPKKPPPPKGKYQNGGHVSTHKLLQDRRQ